MQQWRRTHLRRLPRGKATNGGPIATVPPTVRTLVPSSGTTSVSGSRSRVQKVLLNAPLQPLLFESPALGPQPPLLRPLLPVRGGQP